MEVLNQILNILGNISNVILLVTIIWGTWAWFDGILPSVLRLGTSLSKRKIAVVAKDNNSTILVNLLVHSEIFKQKNILKVCGVTDLGLLESASIILAQWSDFKQDYKKILEKKKDSDALVVYAPQNEGKVDETAISDLAAHRNVTITNFKGRLVNDLFLSMITSGYKQP